MHDQLSFIEYSKWSESGTLECVDETAGRRGEEAFVGRREREPECETRCESRGDAEGGAAIEV